MIKSATCSQVRRLFSSLRDEWLYPEEEQNVHAHLKMCKACEREWYLYNEALDWLRESTSKTVESVSATVWSRFKEDRAENKKEWLQQYYYEKQIIPLRWSTAFALGVAVTLLAVVFLNGQDEIQNLAVQSFLTQDQFGKVVSLF